MAAKKKVTLYLPEEVLDEIQSEAARQDRSMSWLVEQVWRMTAEHVAEWPGVEELLEDLELEG